MTSTPKLVDRPTQRQLAYLRSLADRTGQTFAYPHTRGQASREIQRLKRAHLERTAVTRGAILIAQLTLTTPTLPIRESTW